jgi:hypothetical protein
MYDFKPKRLILPLEQQRIMCYNVLEKTQNNPRPLDRAFSKGWKIGRIYIEPRNIVGGNVSSLAKKGL